jgi:hypothetical protein
MPPAGIPAVVVWALGVVGAAVLAKCIKDEWQRLNAGLHPQTTVRMSETDNIERKRLPTLRRDPKTGIYRAD